uniref:ShKT domain-containing protein n=1 Tax=Strongyloides venezuelensis TaxID=75913 RepID=A0A0K0G2A7_STRVS
MYNFTSYCIILIYFLGLNFIECDDTKVCAATADCTVANTKCLKDIKKDFDGANGNFCAQLCDAAKVDQQCGTGETCVNVKDIDNADVLSCVKTAQCITDAFCQIFDPQSTCNVFTLKCSAPPTAATSTAAPGAISTTTSTTTTTTTTRKIVTVPEIVDKISGGGPYGCEAHLKYCTDPMWLDLMKTMCPKTCGYTGGVGTGVIPGINTCSDALSDCPSKSAYCKHAAYIDFMRQNCAKTCGYC